MYLVQLMQGFVRQSPNFLCTKEPKMYRNINDGQFSIYDFILPFGGHLKEDNRWVQLRNMIDWQIIDEEYSRHFRNKAAGQEAYPSSVAFGSLYIQRRLGLTDRELIDQISENPYMQYFIGYKEFRDEKPFDASFLVTFRKRLPEDVMNRIIERMFIEKAKNNQSDDGDDDRNDDDNDAAGGQDGGSSSGGESASQSTGKTVNKGTLIIDATCTPADIAFPTDLELCDKARTWTEIILDHYWKLFGSSDGEKKPRTYREVARRRYLTLAKRRRKSAKKIRKELRYQLGCIHRNLEYIDVYASEYGLDCLHNVERERLLTIIVFYSQQKEMLDTKTHRVQDRIVSLSQPWIRPIVRGKAKAPTEFGAKLSVSVVGGYTFIDKLSFDAYNEGEASEFEQVVEKYRKRFGHYPERILADKIYRSKANRAFCKDHGIHLSGPRLGRPGKDHSEELLQELKEIGERNEVEGKFGNGKRKLGLSRIMAKLAETTGAMIGMDIFILNMEKLMRQEASLVCSFLGVVFSLALSIRKQHKNNVISGAWAAV